MWPQRSPISKSARVFLFLLEGVQLLYCRRPDWERTLLQVAPKPVEEADGARIH